MKLNDEEEIHMNFMQRLEKIMTERYGPTIVAHANNPQNMGPLEDSSGHISYTGPCGDTMNIWVKITDDTLENISFLTDGCDFTRATGSMLTGMAKGKSVNEALQITPSQIEEALGGLPEDHKHCPLLATVTLRKAIDNHYQAVAE
jgi:nitrogen fixation NifU-like protein